MDTQAIRQRLFDRFSGQLQILIQQGVLNLDLHYPKTYICPICLRQFEEADLHKRTGNYLTLEDAPPDALGGSKIALTCKQCNNECGYKIDFHLAEVIREIDASYFYKGTVHKGYILHEGNKVSVELTSMGDGTLQAYHRIKNNNPTFLNKLIYGLQHKQIGPVLNFEPPPSRVIPERVNYALVKVNYIISFSKFGYLFLLHPAYDTIREQLQDPENSHYPYTPFFKDQFTAEDKGTYYIHNPGLKSILNVFTLRTKYSETVIGGTLPFPLFSTEQYADRINVARDANKIVTIDTTTYDPDANIFSDYQEMAKILGWIFTP